MNQQLAAYFSKYSIDQSGCALQAKLNGADLHIFGASGALGTSLLLFLQLRNLKPKAITLYVRNYLGSTQLRKVCNDDSVNVIEINSDDLAFDLTKIGSSSTVIFLAGFAQPALFLKDPRSLFHLNINLLGLIIDRRPDNIFYASTAEIYSGVDQVEAESSPFISQPQDIRGAYIEAKRAGEALLYHSANEGKRWVSFRIALATPPWHFPDDKRVLSDLLSTAISGSNISLKGGEESIRQYQYGPLMIEKLLWAGFFGTKPVYNLAGGESLSLECIARVIADVYGVEYCENPERKGLKLGAPRAVNIQNEALNLDLGFVPKTESFLDLLMAIRSMSS